jgi:hypothetical protein
MMCVVVVVVVVVMFKMLFDTANVGESDKEKSYMRDFDMMFYVGC